MQNYKEYNEEKLREAFAKLFSGNIKKEDILEAIMNFTIDNTVEDEYEREKAKAHVSSAKETVQNILENK